MTTFQVGRTYYDRSAGDHECVYSLTIQARTAKTVTVIVRARSVKRRITVWNGVEQFKPFACYSMIISADRPYVAEAA